MARDSIGISHKPEMQMVKVHYFNAEGVA